jgi:EpsI family protein
MGQISNRKIGVLVLCFLLVGVIVNIAPSSKAVVKKNSLNEALQLMQGWKGAGPMAMDDGIVKGLDLDDYVNQMFSNGKESVWLYIGYYLTSQKIGAAHDPLVCFPGQGWTLSGAKRGTLDLKPGLEGSVSYSEMIAERGLHKELVIYWFQSYDKAISETFSQKLSALVSKISKGREDNAFVRISITLDDRTDEEGLEVISNFIKAFYPVFLKYVRDGNEGK